MEPQRELGRQQAQLGRHHAELGRLQAVARQIAQGMAVVVHEAIANGPRRIEP